MRLYRKVTMRPYCPASWFHSRGIYKVVSKIKDRIPNLSGSLFITFTLDPELFEDGPKDAFLKARQKLRKVFYALRKGAKWDSVDYLVKAPYCVKLEFHKNGWPHFHVVFRTRRFLPADLVNHLWGLGRSDVRRVGKKDFEYLFKYVSKGGALPDWVKELSKVRIWQTSRGFYEKALPKAKTKRGPRAKSQRFGLNIGERLESWDRMALLESDAGKYAQQPLARPFSEILNEEVISIAREGRYLGNNQVLLSDPFQLKDWLK